MRSKTILTMASLALLFLLGGCFNGNKTAGTGAGTAQNAGDPQSVQESDGQAPAAADQEPDKGEGTVSGTLSSLLGLGRALHCTYDSADGQDRILSDMYISGNKYSLEVTFPDSGKFFTIGDGEWVYTWNTRVPGGTKMRIEEKDADKVGDAAAESTEQENYTCTPWIADQSKFVPPSGIEFADETAEIQALEADLQENPIDKCGLCDSLPDPTLKAKCLENSGCAQ